MEYKLNIISGTIKVVESELKQKFPGVKITSTTSRSIEFESEVQDIDDFRIIYSALHVTKNGGLTRNLYRRDWQSEYVPAGINPALGYILCKLADIQKDDVCLDPFCGAGTIAVSAAKYFEPKKSIASDISGPAVDKAIRNFRNAKIPKYKFATFRTGVAQLKLQKEYVTKVITNLPFGIRANDHEQNIEAYKHFAQKMSSAVATGGKLVILTQEKNLISEVMKPKQFELIENFDIKQGGLIPSVFLYSKR